MQMIRLRPQPAGAKPQPPLPDTVYAAWPANGAHNGLIITTLPLTVHVVFTRNQARDIINDHTASGGAVDAYNNTFALPDKPGPDAVHITGYAASTIADAIRTACVYREDPPAEPVAPRTLTFFSAPLSSEPDRANALCTEVDEAGNAHVYIFFCKEDARAHLASRITWASHALMVYYRMSMEASLVPDTDDRPAVRIDGKVAQTVLDAIHTYLQALQEKLPIPPP